MNEAIARVGLLLHKKKKQRDQIASFGMIMAREECMMVKWLRQGNLGLRLGGEKDLLFKIDFRWSRQVPRDTSHNLFGRDTFGSHIAAHVCTHAPENSINGCDLMLEGGHYHVSGITSVWAHTC